jgi:hypothetical protein
MDNKTMVIYVSVSTNPATAHIGRYFLDIRDQTRPTQDPRGRQMTTRVTNDPLGFIRDATAAGLAQGVMVTFEDETGEGLDA